MGGTIEAAFEALVHSGGLVDAKIGQAHSPHVHQHIRSRYVEWINLLR